MRRLIRFGFWAAVLAGVAKYLGDRLVPAADTTPSDPPRYRAPPPPPAEPPPEPVPSAGPADDLEQVTGIGPVFAARLAKAGVTSFADLATADGATLAAQVDVPAHQIADWIDQARRLSG